MRPEGRRSRTQKTIKRYDEIKRSSHQLRYKQVESTKNIRIFALTPVTKTHGKALNLIYDQYSYLPLNSNAFKFNIHGSTEGHFSPSRSGHARWSPAQVALLMKEAGFEGGDVILNSCHPILGCPRRVVKWLSWPSVYSSQKLKLIANLHEITSIIEIDIGVSDINGCRPNIVSFGCCK